MRRVLFIAFAAGAIALRAQTPSADEIMQRVAANQDRAQQARTRYVYHQKLLIRTLDSHGKLRGEESTEYTAAPTADGTKRQLNSISGRVLKKGRYIEYQATGPGEHANYGVDNDNEIADELRAELLDDGSRDGINRKLFPLTTREIAQYAFELKGEEIIHGSRAWRIAFAPKERPGAPFDIDTDEGPWAGEALIDVAEFQPISITTKLARGVPAAVRILLGTNIRGLGFSVDYRKTDSGVCFPMSFGTEFSVRGLFFWYRTITVSLLNSDFKKADVSSTIAFDEP